MNIFVQYIKYNVMKYIVKLISIALAFTCIACNNPQKKEAEVWEQKMQAKRLAKQARLQEYADSTVALSFKGIELGQPFLKTVQEARKKGSIYALSYGKDRESATCKATVNLLDKEKPLEVDIMIASYQDTITSFVVMSEDYDTHNDLERLYISKYDGTEGRYSTDENEEQDWGDRVERSKSYSTIWTFKNQSIRYTTFLTEKRENYVKNPEMRSPQNRYGIKYTNYFKAVTIIYTDFYHCKKVEDYELAIKKEEARLREIEKRKQARADSIKKAELKRKAENQDI